MASLNNTPKSNATAARNPLFILVSMSIKNTGPIMTLNRKPILHAFRKKSIYAKLEFLFIKIVLLQFQ